MLKVSVIVAVRNNEKDLFRCVSSLVEQTLADIEIILVDNGSTDQSREMMADYQAQFPEMIRCAYLEETVGLGQARNRGMELAQGEYLTFVDAGDFVEPAMCEDLYFAADGADICGADYWTEFGGNTRDVYPNYGPGREMNARKLETYLNGCGSFATRLYRREYLQAHGIRFLEDTHFEATYFVFMSALHADDAVKVEGRYHHICVDTNALGVTERYQRLNIPARILNDCKACSAFETHRDLIEYKYIAMQMGNIRNVCMEYGLFVNKNQLGKIAADVRQNLPDFAKNPLYKKAPWNLRVYLRLTMVSPGLAAFVRLFDWLINICTTIHDAIVK